MEGDGPVIGGATSLSASPPAPPPPGSASPGAGNLSGLVLVLALFGLAAAKMGGTAFKKFRAGSLARQAQEKAKAMAAEMRSAAANAQAESPKGKGAKKKEKKLAATKRTAGKSSSNAKFSRLQTDEEEGVPEEVEVCGEEDAEDEGMRFGGNGNEEACDACDSTNAQSTIKTTAVHGDSSKPKGGPPKKARQSSKQTAGPPEGEGLRFGRDDATRAKHKPSPPAARTECAHDGASEATFDFGEGNSNDQPIFLEPVSDDEGDGEDEEDDEEISPNDSVSNIGFSRPIGRNVFRERAQAREACRSSQRNATRNGGSGGPGVLPMIGEERSGDAPEHGASKKKKSPRDADAPQVMSLGQLDSSSPFFQRGKGSIDDDGFSAVHEAHMAMRSRIPAEIPIDLTQPTGARGKGVHKCDGKSRQRAMPMIIDDEVDEARSDVTFNFNAVATNDTPAMSFATRLPQPSLNDDDSDVASDVTFNFGENVQPAKPLRPRPSGVRKKAQPLAPPVVEKQHGSSDDDACSGVTFDFGETEAATPAVPKGAGKRPIALPAATSLEKGAKARNKKGATKKSGSCPRMAASIPGPRDSHGSGDEEGVASGSEDEGQAVMQSSTQRKRRDDDELTSVALSSCPPRDPYLYRMRGLRANAHGKRPGGVIGLDGLPVAAQHLT